MSGIDIRAMVLREDPPNIFAVWTAMDFLRATGRGDGPLDGACEVCHKPWEGSFTLMNWLDWHCQPCSEVVTRAKFEAALAAGLVVTA